jgi:hypothetical protein
METYNAKIDRKEDGNVSLLLEIGTNELSILLTEDNPNAIKSVFNRLLQILKKGEIEFVLNDEIDDLYTHICREYLIQLNNELSSTFSELKDNGLLDQSE